MTTDTQTNETQTPDPNAKGLPEGVSPADTGEGDRGAGAPKAPVVNNAPPPKEQTPEEKAKEEAELKAKEAEAAKAAEDKPEDDTKEEEALTDYPDYGDPAADAVVGLFKEAKITVAEANELLAEAIETGDFSKVDLAKLTEKLGKDKAQLVMIGVQQYYNNVTAGVKEVTTAVYESVGGQANYEKVQAWAKAKASKDAAFKSQMEGLNAMFDLNKTAALMAAKELVTLYEADSGNSSLQKKQIRGDAAVSTANSPTDYISRKDYNKQIKQAYDDNDGHKIASLRARRAASIQIEQN